MDSDVIIVGAGPTGLMLAAELRLAGVRTLLLERRPQISETAKAGGLIGQILQLLQYRGILDRFQAASSEPSPPSRFPFGGLHVDFTPLADPLLHALRLPQPGIERLLEQRAAELGADIRRQHELIDIDQTKTRVSTIIQNPEGTAIRATARFLVGCDGARSRVRERAGFSFPGITYPEVNRLAEVTMTEEVTLLDNGHLDVPGLGTIPSASPTPSRVFLPSRRPAREPCRSSPARTREPNTTMTSL